MKEIKELHKSRDSKFTTRIGRLNTVNMSVLPNLINNPMQPQSKSQQEKKKKQLKVYIQKAKNPE
jgi:hypothetical protein